MIIDLDYPEVDSAVLSLYCVSEKIKHRKHLVAKFGTLEVGAITWPKERLPPSFSFPFC